MSRRKFNTALVASSLAATLAPAADAAQTPEAAAKPLAGMIAGKLVGEESAKRIQLLIEYDAKPPFAAGSPEQAGPSISSEILSRRGALIREAEQVSRAAGARLGI